MYFNNGMLADPYGSANSSSNLIDFTDIISTAMESVQIMVESDNVIMRAMCEADVAEAYIKNGNSDYEPVYESAIGNIFSAIKKMIAGLINAIKKFFTSLISKFSQIMSGCKGFVSQYDAHAAKGIDVIVVYEGYPYQSSLKSGNYYNDIMHPSYDHDMSGKHDRYFDNKFPDSAKRLMGCGNNIESYADSVIRSVDMFKNNMMRFYFDGNSLNSNLNSKKLISHMATNDPEWSSTMRHNAGISFCLAMMTGSTGKSFGESDNVYGGLNSVASMRTEDSLITNMGLKYGENLSKYSVGEMVGRILRDTNGNPAKVTVKTKLTRVVSELKELSANFSASRFTAIQKKLTSSCDKLNDIVDECEREMKKVNLPDDQKAFDEYDTISAVINNMKRYANELSTKINTAIEGTQTYLMIVNEYSNSLKSAASQGMVITSDTKF